MFTGIIEEIGRVRKIKRGRASLQITITCHKVLSDTKVGDSIAVNGACLTVVQLDADGFTADIMPETARKTTLAELPSGICVNLERALRLGDRLGGHLVAGHVDGVGRIRSKKKEEIAVSYDIDVTEEVERYIVPQGSVALDGISLTVAAIRPGGFSVAVIPHTAAATTLREKAAGDKINVENDLIGKYIEKLCSHNETVGHKRMDTNFLRTNGFL